MSPSCFRKIVSGLSLAEEGKLTTSDGFYAKLRALPPVHERVPAKVSREKSDDIPMQSQGRQAHGCSEVAGDRRPQGRQEAEVVQ